MVSEKKLKLGIIGFGRIAAAHDTVGAGQEGGAQANVGGIWPAHLSDK